MSLEEIVKQRILEDGPMSVSQFMALALGHPQYGYYMKRDPFGADGDFTTAPEISQMFGEMIGAWVADIWAQLGQPARFYLVECGPGRGTLMADMMRVLPEDVRKACKIVLMEMSPVLKAKQKESLKGFEVLWVNALDEISAHGPVVLIANEFLDALPVRQFVGKNERVVKVEDGKLVFDPSSGAIVETSDERVKFFQDVCALIEKQRGAALFVDYGYFSGTGDTLQAVYRHKFCDVLVHIGDADVTAHVDFGTLRDATTLPLFMTEQGKFLRGLGIEKRAEYLLKKASTGQAEQIKSGLRRLIADDEMGKLFKVMGVVSGSEIHPAGF